MILADDDDVAADADAHSKDVLLLVVVTSVIDSDSMWLKIQNYYVTNSSTRIQNDPDPAAVLAELLEWKGTLLSSL